MLTHIHVTDTVRLLLRPDVAGTKNFSLISILTSPLLHLESGASGQWAKVSSSSLTT